MPIDIELLIEVYKSEEGFWDSGNANYLNMDVRQAALRRIAGHLGSNVTGGEYYVWDVLY
jgi:Alcohol dehydrogenase transcription factor Myb/SANT-like